MSDLLTSEEAASFLRIPIRTVERLAREKKLLATKAAGSWRFTEEYLQDYLNNNLNIKEDEKLIAEKE